MDLGHDGIPVSYGLPILTEQFQTEESPLSSGSDYVPSNKIGYRDDSELPGLWHCY